MESVEFYQIHLYSRGVIEIFQNVFYYKIDTINEMILIKYSSCKNIGACTISERPIDKIYNIEFKEAAEFEPSGPNPRDKKIIMHGVGRSITYNPESEQWE
jgi:hypothetical protein